MIDFTVLLPVYYKDNPDWFWEAFRSINIDQTLKPKEVILCVDGELPPALESVVQKILEYDNVSESRCSENVGLGKNLENGLRLCKTEYVARQDSDDISLFNRFEVQARFLGLYDVVGGVALEFEGEFTGGYDRIRSGTPTHEISKKAWLKNPLTHPTVMFKKSKVLDVGGYLDMPLFEDYYLWLRSIKKGLCIGNIEEPMIYFRAPLAQLSRRHGLKYLRKELYFLNRCRDEKLIGFTQYIVKCLVSCILRIMPLTVFQLLTKHILRKKKFTNEKDRFRERKGI